jgi:membrane fusion protein
MPAGSSLPSTDGPPASSARAQPLFRQIAIDHAAGSQIGEALEVYWRGVRWFTLGAFALLAVLLAFLAVVEYVPIHRVPAYTDVAGGMIRLSAIEDARISKILVEEGASVDQGDTLAVLDTDRLNASGRARGAALADKLGNERAMLAREIAAARSEAHVMHNLADRKVAGLTEQRASLAAQIVADEQLLNSLRAQSTRISKVAGSGYAAQLQADQKQDEVLLQESRLATARAALASIDKDIDVTRIERQLADTRLASIVESRERESGELDRALTLAEVDASQLVVAPQAGTVSSALIVRGQSVLVGQTLFTVAPQGEPLVVRVLVPARAAAAVLPGLEIKLALHAYPQERFGQFDATVERVSATPLMPIDLPPIYAADGPAYVAVARFSTVPRGPEGELSLKPGMLADALVPMERRTALMWLLEPLLRGFNAGAGQAPAVEDRRP